MKRSGKLLLLIILLLLIAASVVLVRNQVLENAKTTPTDPVFLFSIDKEAVTGMCLEFDGETNRFSRENGIWIYTEDPEFPVSPLKLDTVLTNLNALQSTKWIENPEETAEYGLDTPWCAITVTAGDRDLRVAFGNETTISGKRYASNGDGRVYTVTSGQSNAFTFHLLELVQLEQAPAMERVDSFRLTGGPEPLLLRQEEDGWYLIREDVPVPADSQAVNDLISGILTTVFTDCVAYKPDSETLHAFGMDGELVNITLEYTTDGTSGVYALELDPNGVYGRCVGSNRIYVLGTGVSWILSGCTADDLIAPN